METARNDEVIETKLKIIEPDTVQRFRRPAENVKEKNQHTEVLRPTDFLVRTSKSMKRASAERRARIKLASNRQVQNVIDGMYVFKGKFIRYRLKDLKYDVFQRGYLRCAEKPRDKVGLDQESAKQSSPPPVYAAEHVPDTSTELKFFAPDLSSAESMNASSSRPKLARFFSVTPPANETRRRSSAEFCRGRSASVLLDPGSHNRKKKHTRTSYFRETQRQIPAAVKNAVWDRWNGRLGFAPCFCCRRQEIRMSSFHCGHVVARSKGGSDEVENLRPICQSCNSSMGSCNMAIFIQKFGLHSAQA